MLFTSVMILLLFIYIFFILLVFLFSLPVSLYFQFKVPAPSPPPTMKHAIHTSKPPTKPPATPPTTTTAPTTTTTTPTTQATTITTPLATTTNTPATTSTPTTLPAIPEPTVPPTFPMLPTLPSQITTTTPSFSTLPVLKERTSEEILLASETEAEALSEAKSVVITISSLDTGMETEPPHINAAAIDQTTSETPTQAAVLLFSEEVTPLVEPVTDAQALPSSPQIVEESLPLAEPPTEIQNITPSESLESVGEDSNPVSLLPTVPAVLPSGLPVPSERDAELEVLHIPPEEVGMAENDTTAFSATTVLSGDGELDHISPGYPRLLGVDSEADYHYDMANLPVSPHEHKFLPASLLPTGGISDMATYEPQEILPNSFFISSAALVPFTLFSCYHQSSFSYVLVFTNWIVCLCVYV